MFGRSVFETVLERLKAEAQEAEAAGESESSRPSAAVGPSAPFVVGAGSAFTSANHAAAAYRNVFDDSNQDTVEHQRIAPPPPPPHLLRTAPEDVAADLGLTGQETRPQLVALRRAFARDNHPDGVPAELRPNATRRMTIANMLLDETLRRLQAEEAIGLKR
ncbi:hypothetical protein J2Y48_002913 [Mycoplana sp. BE70]|uniref:hypothetical protein n=1 Tax=Mycoplana sp. BE70 TaxID=2817775 RepID=UPI0028606EA8|nr:hypothetical protein [Mycoplana sp. BE70]MDR6757616.1 hypothetical protein [Mycoplana sp. BE70]